MKPDRKTPRKHRDWQGGKSKDSRPLTPHREATPAGQDAVELVEPWRESMSLVTLSERLSPGRDALPVLPLPPFPASDNAYSSMVERSRRGCARPRSACLPDVRSAVMDNRLLIFAGVFWCLKAECRVYMTTYPADHQQRTASLCCPLILP